MFFVQIPCFFLLLLHIFALGLALLSSSEPFVAHQSKRQPNPVLTFTCKLSPFVSPSGQKPQEKSTFCFRSLSV